jgi:hypothetical protein
MREFDLSDAGDRRSMYGVVLTQGRRNDVARFLNPGLLRDDWPVIRGSLDPSLRRWCERRFTSLRVAKAGTQEGSSAAS